MYISLILDPDACVYDTSMYVAYILILDPWTLDACMMYIPMVMILDANKCRYKRFNNV